MPLPKNKEQLFLVQASFHNVKTYYTKTVKQLTANAMAIAWERFLFLFTVSFLSLFNGCSSSADSKYFVTGKLTAKLTLKYTRSLAIEAMKSINHSFFNTL